VLTLIDYKADQPMFFAKTGKLEHGAIHCGVQTV
jgi:hypothetical protein